MGPRQFLASTMALTLTIFPDRLPSLAQSVGKSQIVPIAHPTIPAIVPALPAILVEAPEPRYAAATLRDRIGRIWAPVFINGQGPFRLVLDTGANRTAVLASVAIRLGLPMSPSGAIKLHGATGTAEVPVINVDRVEVGDLVLTTSAVPIIADVFGGAEGVLGNEGLENRRVLIDFAHDIVSITRSKGARAPPGFSSIPIKFVKGKLLSVYVSIGSIRTRAIIDTGAQQTVGNLALRAALGHPEKDQVRTQSIQGVTLELAPTDSRSAPTVSIGNVDILNMRVSFGQMLIFDYWDMTREPALLVGMDVLGSLDTLIIDYKLRELQIRPRQPGQNYH